MNFNHEIWPTVVKTEFINSNIVVLKFGGTSVKDLSSWEKIYTLVAERIESGLIPFVVNSAVSGVSNQLIRIASDINSDEVFLVFDDIKKVHLQLCNNLSVDPEIISNELSNLESIVKTCHITGAISLPEYARIMASGELLASIIGHNYLSNKGLSIELVDSRDFIKSIDSTSLRESSKYISVDASYNFNKVLTDYVASLGKVFIAPGYIASNTQGETVLLGRGGSDTSASYYASMMNALRLEIWTDVRGFYDADPSVITDASNINHLSYEEAHEIASSGGSVLHPKAIPPMKDKNIPIFIFSSKSDELIGTVIDASKINVKPEVIAITRKNNVTVMSISSSAMWHQAGYLADIFSIFRDHDISIDLVSTSETNITVSIDTASNSILNEELELLKRRLKEYGELQVFNDCTSISLIGHKIKNLIQRISPSLSFFEDNEIYLFTHSASGLNLSFVINNEPAYKVFQNLYHDVFRFLQNAPGHRNDIDTNFTANQWWANKQNKILSLLDVEASLYVYDLDTVKESYKSLNELKAFSRVFYAIKANDNADIIRSLDSIGSSFECVSKAEINYLIDILPNLSTDKILFTPNFISHDELKWSISNDIMTTIDNEYIFYNWASSLVGKRIFLRVDTGYGQGHHEHVKTAGDNSKFGIPMANVSEVINIAKENNIDIIGLHAHSGSGINRPENWTELLRLLLLLAPEIKNLKYIDIGGGLGVTDIVNQDSINLKALSDELLRLIENTGYELWIEPGRYIVANAGILVSKVNQLKTKGDLNYIGISTGMNSLIRPALYGAYHQVVNLSRLHDEPTVLYTVVGPICETGDRIARDRWLPETREGDIILIANAGAYGHVMSSHYNRRNPAKQETI
jgi:bifunctional diaminopimelate decarboxylase / aspartate kinase